MARRIVPAVVGLVVLVVVVAAGLAVALSQDSGPQTEAPVLVIAHRGASAYAPHDTVAAAREAVERRADAVEVDVRQTRDGHLVALFRPSLAPTTDVERVFPGRAPWRVESFTLAEVRRLDAGSWYGPEFAGERVPTLREVADAVEGSGVQLIIEPKSPGRYPGIADRIAREVQRRPDLYREVESFDTAFLRSLATRSLPVDLGITGAPPVDELAQATAYANAVNPGLAAVDADYVEQAHDLGLEVKVWSVNERAGMRRAVEMGVDGIYTHRPDVLNDVLGVRAR